MKTQTEYKLKRGAVAAIVILIIIIAALAYLAGGALGSTTVTVASTTTTQLEVTTFTASTVSSFTVESYVIQVSTEYVTVTQQGPDEVLVTGTVVMKTPGTIPQTILFSSATKNYTLRAQTSDGRYAIQVPNHDYYNVFLEYGTSVANVGAGKCLAGAMGAWFIENPPEMSWSC